MNLMYLLMILVSTGLPVSSDIMWTKFCSEEYFDYIIQKDSKISRIDFYRNQKGSDYHWVLSYNSESKSYDIVEYNTIVKEGYNTDMVMRSEYSRKPTAIKLSWSDHFKTWGLEFYQDESFYVLFLKNTRDMKFSGLFADKDNSSVWRVVGKHNHELEKTQFVYSVTGIGNWDQDSKSVYLTPKDKTSDKITDFFGCAAWNHSGLKTTTTVPYNTTTLESPDDDFNFWVWFSILTAFVCLLIVVLIAVVCILCHKKSESVTKSHVSGIPTKSVADPSHTGRSYIKNN